MVKKIDPRKRVLAFKRLEDAKWQIPPWVIDDGQLKNVETTLLDTEKEKSWYRKDEESGHGPGFIRYSMPHYKRDVGKGKVRLSTTTDDVAYKCLDCNQLSIGAPTMNVGDKGATLEYVCHRCDVVMHKQTFR